MSPSLPLRVTLLALACASTSHAQSTLVVSILTDEANTDGDCSLREAILSANLGQDLDECVDGVAQGGTISGPFTIRLVGGNTYILSIAGGSEDVGLTGDLDVTTSQPITLISNSNTLQAVVDGAGLDRVLDVKAGANVTLTRLHLTNGHAPDGANGAGGTTTGQPGDPGQSGGGILNAGTLTLIESTVSNSSAGNGGTGECITVGGIPRCGSSGKGGDGGGLYSSGVLTLTRCTISSNAAGRGGNLNPMSVSPFPGSGGSGGGIYNGNMLVVRNCTISANAAGRAGAGGVGSTSGSSGGGLHNLFSATATLEAVTVAGNAAQYGGGLRHPGGTTMGMMTLRGVLAADNTLFGTGIGTDCEGDFNSQGYNLFENASGCRTTGATATDVTGVDPALSPLADNGGLTRTQAISGSSAAVNQIPASAGCGTDPFDVDQRGFPRTAGLCDIGAFEADAVLPVELAAFTATAVGDAVHLAWTTLSETNNAYWGIERQTPLEAWREIARMPGQGTTSEQHRYAQTLRGFATGIHRFRLRQVDLDGTAHLSHEIEVTIQPTHAFSLSEVQPNPAQTTARLSLTLREAQPVRATLYDALGRTVRVLFEEMGHAERALSIPLNLTGLAPGIYTVRVQTAAFEAVRRVVVVR